MRLVYILISWWKCVYFCLYFTMTVRAGCANGDLRLVNGGNESEGIVEICRDEAWGSIATLGWSVYDAQVTCRQLGYPSECKNHHINEGTIN